MTWPGPGPGPTALSRSPSRPSPKSTDPSTTTVRTKIAAARSGRRPCGDPGSSSDLGCRPLDASHIAGGSSRSSARSCSRTSFIVCLQSFAKPPSPFAEMNVDRGSACTEDGCNLIGGSVRVVVQDDRQSLVRRDGEQRRDEMVDRLRELVDAFRGRRRTTTARLEDSPGDAKSRSPDPVLPGHRSHRHVPAPARTLPTPRRWRSPDPPCIRRGNATAEPPAAHRRETARRALRSRAHLASHSYRAARSVEPLGRSLRCRILMEVVALRQRLDDRAIAP